MGMPPMDTGPPEDPKKRYESADDVPSRRNAVGCLLLIVGFILISVVLNLLDIL